jgi:SAM-dependent methyltransferase
VSDYLAHGGADITARMRDDWNARAREDAGYYVAFGRRDQDDAGFFATAADVVRRLESELRRFPPGETHRLKALEIGCGPGRLMRPMSRHFAEIHGVDVSDEMIALAREKLRDIPNAYPHVSNGAGLKEFADHSFGFVYSYAVFQHIPSREVVYEYLREIRRVLEPGGVALLQFNGLPRDCDSENSYNTWMGARFSAGEILEFTRLRNPALTGGAEVARDLQVLMLEGALTQYMWTAWRKGAAESGPIPALTGGAETGREVARIRGITNASSSEPVAPSRGRFASISLWVENLPSDAGLHDLRVFIGGQCATVEYIGPPKEGLQQVNAALPELDRTGLLPVELRRFDRRIAPPATLRVIPPPPLAPVLKSITDGVNLVAYNRIETRFVKMILDEIERPEEIRVSVSGHALASLDWFRVDPRPRRFEVNFPLPPEIGPGAHLLEATLGWRKLAVVPIEVVG